MLADLAEIEASWEADEREAAAVLEALLESEEAEAGSSPAEEADLLAEDRLD